MIAERNAGDESRKVAELAAIQRKVLDLNSGDDFADAGVLGIDERRFSRHFDVLRLARESHAEGDQRGRLDVDVRLAGLGAETGERGLHLIDSNRESGDPVGALSVGGGGTGEARARVRRGDRDARKRQTLLVEDGAIDQTIGALRVRGHESDEC